VLKNPFSIKPANSAPHRYRATLPKSITLLYILLASQTLQANTPTATDIAALYEPETTYSIFRKGKNIGKHSLKFITSHERVNVTIDSRITVRMLKIPVFKFSYLSEELWENNQLKSVTSVTTTNKEVENASMTTNAERSLLKNDKGETAVPSIAYATNHWHIGAVEQSTLFNTIKGTPDNVEVEKIENETLQIGDFNLPVTHYKYSGDITAESWYDINNRWVKLSFLGTDGNQITYVIDNP